MFLSLLLHFDYCDFVISYRSYSERQCVLILNVSTINENSAGRLILLLLKMTIIITLTQGPGYNKSYRLILDLC